LTSPFDIEDEVIAVGFKNKSGLTFRHPRPLWIDAGSPIEGPLLRSEHVIVIRYRWGLCECRAERQQRQITGLL
jgi:hypothetical protein